jgi:hypothetical protein
MCLKDTLQVPDIEIASCLTWISSIGRGVRLPDAHQHRGTRGPRALLDGFCCELQLGQPRVQPAIRHQRGVGALLN